VFQSLLAEFVGGQVISLCVSGSGGGVSVLCQVVQLCRSIMRTLGHRILLTCSMQTIGESSWDCFSRPGSS
jgi:hypothetical protein